MIGNFGIFCRALVICALLGGPALSQAHHHGSLPSHLRVQATTMPASGPDDEVPTDKPAGVIVTVLLQAYTYPLAISTTGTYVIGTPFGGGAGYFWSAASGMTYLSGSINGVADNGIIAGTYANPGVLYNGNPVQTAGKLDPFTSAWTFLGMNPAAPTTFAQDYNSGWDITSDGSTVVGMQYTPGYAYSAFKWTQAGGYVNIGSGVGSGSRASGISANGSVVFGWAMVGSVNRTPVVWYNNQSILVNSALYGEAFGASTSGNYVVGTLDGDGFRWSPQGTVIFTNTLTNGDLSPTTVLNNGAVFGYTEPPLPNPTARRAFARDSLGVLMTFNDYAEARGLENAQQWLFYSINDATADGKKFIGSGIDPSGQTVTFIMEFNNAAPIFTAMPARIDFGSVPVGSQAPFQNLTIKNTGTANLVINGTTLEGTDAAQFIMHDNHTYPLTLVPSDTIIIPFGFMPASTGLKQAVVKAATNAGLFQVQLAGKGIQGVGLGELILQDVRVFPNPVAQTACIDCREGVSSVMLFSRGGRMISERFFNGMPLVTFDMSDLPSGNYLLRIRKTDGTVRAISVIKQ